MEAIKISDERMEVLLPQEIKDTKVLSKNAKKILATLINYFLSSDKAQSEGYLACSNSLLREACEMNMDEMHNGLEELKLSKLIVRKAGKSREKGKKPKASEYYIQWENLNKEVVKITPIEYLLELYTNVPETPIGTANTNNNSKPSSNYNSKPNYNSKSNHNSSLIMNSNHASSPTYESMPNTDLNLTDSSNKNNHKPNHLLERTVLGTDLKEETNDEKIERLRNLLELEEEENYKFLNAEESKASSSLDNVFLTEDDFLF